MGSHGRQCRYHMWKNVLRIYDVRKLRSIELEFFCAIVLPEGGNKKCEKYLFIFENFCNWMGGSNNNYICF